MRNWRIPIRRAQTFTENIIQDTGIVLVANGWYGGVQVYKSLFILSIGKFMLLRVTTVASNNWVRYLIWHDIYRLLVPRGIIRFEWISQDPHMPVLYDRILDRSRYWTEINYIRPGCTMGFWKLLFFHLVFQQWLLWTQMDFSGTFKKTFQKTLLIPVHAVARVDHKSIRNEGFCRYLNKV